MKTDRRTPQDRLLPPTAKMTTLTNSAPLCVSAPTGASVCASTEARVSALVTTEPSVLQWQGGATNNGAAVVKRTRSEYLAGSVLYNRNQGNGMRIDTLSNGAQEIFYPAGAPSHEMGKWKNIADNMERQSVAVARLRAKLEKKKAASK